MGRFIVLFRAFFAQFFTNELATSDIQLRQVMIWVLAFLLTPGLFILLHVGFVWDHVITLPPGVVDDLLAQLGVLFVTHSIVSTGLVAVLVWDALSFNRRDAVVLGTLPVRDATIVAAKLTALAAFLLSAAAAINVPSAGLFAVMTGSHAGFGGVLQHFAAHVSATVGAGIFVFGIVASVRGAIALLTGTRIATSAGSALQFVFVGVLLWFLISIPSAMTGRTPWMMAAGAAEWLPSAWFLAVFEALLGSSRATGALAARAVAGIMIALAAAALIVGVGFRRQMRLAVAPPAKSSDTALARISVAAAHVLAGRQPVARATSEFILVTLMRNRTQQAPIVINAAIGLALVVAGLSTASATLEGLRHPRTAVLWIPLVFAYWMAIGMRAAFFVPAELPASWTFRANALIAGRAWSSAIRASMLVFVVPRALLLSALLAPFVGWRLTISHALFVGAMTIVIVQVVAQTIAFVPFTREYRPGHAKLRIWWPAYAAGLYLFAYLPTRLELLVLADAPAFAAVVASTVLAGAVVAWLGRRTADRFSPPSAFHADDDSDEAISLGIARVVAAGGHR